MSSVFVDVGKHKKGNANIRPCHRRGWQGLFRLSGCLRTGAGPIVLNVPNILPNPPGPHGVGWGMDAIGQQKAPAISEWERLRPHRSPSYGSSGKNTQAERIC
jgi:hypothetical protein